MSRLLHRSLAFGMPSHSFDLSCKFQIVNSDLYIFNWIKTCTNSIKPLTPWGWRNVCFARLWNKRKIKRVGNTTNGRRNYDELYVKKKNLGIAESDSLLMLLIIYVCPQDEAFSSWSWKRDSFRFFLCFVIFINQQHGSMFYSPTIIYTHVYVCMEEQLKIHSHVWYSSFYTGYS